MFKNKLTCTINEHGKDLISINLKINMDGVLITRMFPGCNVEIKECEFAEFDQDGYSSDDYHFRGYDSDSYESDSDDLYDHRRYSDDSWDVSFDDGEQDSNAESGDDETNDILDHFDGGEIDLMFSQNYGEDNNEDDQFMDNAGDFLEALVTSGQD